jgi:hypothetical protein
MSSRELWLAVVVQAVEDLGFRPRAKNKPRAKDGKDFHQRTLFRAKTIRERAFHWVFSSPETDIGSLPWICRQTDINLQAVRRAAMARYRAGASGKKTRKRMAA